jgi:hypothetical protein
MKKQLRLIEILGVMILLLLVTMITANIHKFYPNTVAKQHIISTCLSNETAIVQAVKDIKNGRKYIMLFGLRDTDDKEDEEMRENEQKYGFKYVGMGCMGGDEYHYVYDQIMCRAVNEKAQKMLFRTFDIYSLKELHKKGLVK